MVTIKNGAISRIFYGLAAESFVRDETLSFVFFFWGNYLCDWRRLSAFFARNLTERDRDTTREVKVFIGWSFLNGIWSRLVRPRRTIERPVFIIYCFIHSTIIILLVLQASRSKRCVKLRGERKVGARSFPNEANRSV